MTPYELFDIAQSLVTRIDFHWGLFITVHMALFGGIIYVNRPLRKLEKVATLFIYSGFALINLLMMQNQIEHVHAIYTEIAKFSNDACCINNELILLVSRETEAGRFQWAAVIAQTAHAIMLVLVVLAVIFDRTLVSKSNAA